MTYSQKLKLPMWQRKRLEILNERGFACERCKCDQNELHVHHRRYSRGKEPWDYPSSNFEVLCVDCHTAEHSKELPSMGATNVEIKAPTTPVNTRNHKWCLIQDSNGVPADDDDVVDIMGMNGNFYNKIPNYYGKNWPFLEWPSCISTNDVFLGYPISIFRVEGVGRLVASHYGYKIFLFKLPNNDDLFDEIRENVEFNIHLMFSDGQWGVKIWIERKIKRSRLPNFSGITEYTYVVEQP